MASILVATDRGLHDIAGDAPPAFENRKVTFLAPGPSDVLAIVDGLEIWAADGGWHQVAMSDRLVLTCSWQMGTVQLDSQMPQRFGLTNRIEPVRCLSDDLQVRPLSQQPAHHPPERRVILDDEHSVGANH